MTDKKSEPEEFHIVIKGPQTALEALIEVTAIGANQLKRLAESGAIWLQTDSKPRRMRRLKKVLSKGDQLHCYYNPMLLGAVNPAPVLISDEGDYSIWYKPRGMFSQPSKWSDANAIGRCVELALQRSTWLVHRLDRMTSGLIILSHNKGLVEQFTQAFRQNQIEKTYLAIIEGKLASSTLVIDADLDDKSAHTQVEQIQYDEKRDLSLLKVKIGTGRKHQIRRHLAAAGHPVLGDRLYGHLSAEEEGVRPDLQLIAYQLVFSCPLSQKEKKVRVTGELLSANLLMTLPLEMD